MFQTIKRKLTINQKIIDYLVESLTPWMIVNHGRKVQSKQFQKLLSSHCYAAKRALKVSEKEISSCLVKKYPVIKGMLIEHNITINI